MIEDNPGKVELFLRDGVPVGRNASIELRNMHATYAATWYVCSSGVNSRAGRLALILVRTHSSLRFTLSAFTGFMFYRLMKRPTTVTTAQYRKLKDL